MNFPNDYNEFGLIRDYGDLLEKEFTEKIEQRIPSYAKIWAEYIGNDGTAHALPMEGAKENILESRREYWQRLYTLFESLAFCWDIEEELTFTQTIDNAKAYVQYLNLWMAFYAHLGRIHDMVDKVAVSGKINRPDLIKQWKEFWEQRNIVLHGPKIPLKCINNVVAVPALGEGIRHWNDDMLWEQLGPADFKQISESVPSILREAEPKLEWFLAEMRKMLPKLYDWKPVNWSKFLKLKTGYEEGMVAGSAGWVMPASGVVNIQPPPSGSR